MLKARLTIEGVRPLLFHAFSPEAMNGDRKERRGSAGNDPEEWRKTYRATSEGQLYLVPEQIFGCARFASKFTKKGKGSIQPMVSATLLVVEPRILLNRYVGTPTQNPEDEVHIDVRGVVNPATRGRNVRYRLMTNEGWKAQFTIMFDETVVARGQMEAVFNDAGNLVGLGDGRAIGYGRFKLVSFDVEETAGS